MRVLSGYDYAQVVLWQESIAHGYLQSDHCLDAEHAGAVRKKGQLQNRMGWR